MTTIDNQTVYNPANEKLKRDYLEWFMGVKGRAESTADNVSKSLARFERTTGYKDFRKFKKQDAQLFKKAISGALGEKDKMSLASQKDFLRHVREFLVWLSTQKGFKHIQHSDIEYLTLSLKDGRRAKAPSSTRCPSVEIIHDVVSKMPFESGLQKRDRALVAFTLLSGMRVGAIVSLRLKHVDLETGVITQDSREVATKGSKHITSGFFPVGFEFESIFREWVLHLRELGFQADDPIFPSAEKVRIDNAFVAGRLSRSFYVETEVARKVFKRAFIKAGHPYYNPHSFRKTLVRLGQKVCTTWEEAKAWSQNLGHADIVTTNVDYGRIDDETQIAVVRRLGHSDTNQVESNPDSLTEFIQRVAKEVKKINS